MRRSGDRLRITAQLIEAASGTHLWAERYDRSLEDVFAVQEEIAQSIVATVAQRVRDDREVAARRRPPEDIRAYDLFLQGHRLSDVFTPEAQKQVQALFEQAVQIDPTFARAYTGLAYVHLNRALDGGMWTPREPDEHRLTALRLAEQAVALDPNDPRVQSTLGFMCVYLWDFDRAEHHLDLARGMNPNDAMIQMVWAWLQGCLGKPERGLPAAEISRRLNPHHPGWYNHFLARILFQLGRYGEAAALMKQRNFGAPLRDLRDVGWRAAALGHLGQIEEAQQCSEAFIRSIKGLWGGDPNADSAEYVDWLVDISFLRQRSDVKRLRDGLRLAGLPA